MLVQPRVQVLEAAARLQSGVWRLLPEMRVKGDQPAQRSLRVRQLESAAAHFQRVAWLQIGHQQRQAKAGVAAAGSLNVQ